MKKFVQVKIDSLKVSLTNQQRIVLLKQIDEDRYLPIWIGPFEAESITIALQEIEVSRPQTHDLIKKILEEIGASIIRVEVSSLKEDIFYGTMVLKNGEKEYNIDCRPSDAIAVAVRAHVPILVSEDVMKKASIIPEEVEEDSEDEEGIQNKERSQENRLLQDDERLSIFEDYLTKKDKGGKEEDKKENDEDEDDLSSLPK